MPALEPDATVSATVLQQSVPALAGASINSSMEPAEIIERVFSVRLNADELKGCRESRFVRACVLLTSLF